MKTDSMGVEPEGETAKIVCTEKEIVQGIKKKRGQTLSLFTFFQRCIQSLITYYD